MRISHYYICSENGENKRENVTDWALNKFREHYAGAMERGHPVRHERERANQSAMPAMSNIERDSFGSASERADRMFALCGREITKLGIFHYVYAVLHHPVCREKYRASLKRELPRVPFAPDFWTFADAGGRLAALHVNYETQTEYPLEQIENREKEFTLRIEKMRLSKDKSELRYNRF